MKKFTQGVDDRRKMLAEALGLKEGEEHLEGKDSGVKVRHLGRLRRGSSTTPQACTP